MDATFADRRLLAEAEAAEDSDLMRTTPSLVVPREREGRDTLLDEVRGDAKSSGSSVLEFITPVVVATELAANVETSDAVKAPMAELAKEEEAPVTEDPPGPAGITDEQHYQQAVAQVELVQQYAMAGGPNQQESPAPALVTLIPQAAEQEEHEKASSAVPEAISEVTPVEVLEAPLEAAAPQEVPEDAIITLAAVVESETLVEEAAPPQESPAAPSPDLALGNEAGHQNSEVSDALEPAPSTEAAATEAPAIEVPTLAANADKIIGDDATATVAAAAAAATSAHVETRPSDAE